MSDMVRGTVLGIDRDNGTVRAEIAGVIVPEAPYLGEPPWPLSSCWFFNAPAYTCLGPTGNRRVAFADDFNYYAAAIPFIGTGWTAGGTPGSLSTPNDPTDANGVLRITANTGATVYYIRKALRMVTLTDTRCYWVSARVRQSESAGGIGVGLATPNIISASAAGGTDAAAMMSVYGPVTTTTVASQAGTSSTGVTTGESVANDTWCWVDVMVVGGQWVAGWVDGSGPWVSTTTLPTTSNNSVTPFVRAGAAASNNVDVDYFSLAQVDLTTTADPTTFGELDPIDDVLT